MFLRVRNQKIMLRKSENKGKHLFYANFCVIATLSKGPFRPKIQDLKIDKGDGFKEISFGFLK